MTIQIVSNWQNAFFWKIIKDYWLISQQNKTKIKIKINDLKRDYLCDIQKIDTYLVLLLVIFDQTTYFP